MGNFSFKNNYLFKFLNEITFNICSYPKVFRKPIIKIKSFPSPAFIFDDVLEKKGIILSLAVLNANYE